MSSLLVLDMGSNAIKAELVDYETSAFLYTERVETRIGASVRDGVLPESALCELLEKTRDLVERMQEFAAQQGSLPVLTQCVATGIFRSLSNQSEVISRFNRIPCFRMKVISEETEARLERLGVETSPLIQEHPHSYFLAMDFGGGSTEFSLFCLGEEPLMMRSIPVGQHALRSALAAGEVHFLERHFSFLKGSPALNKAEFVIVAGSAMLEYARFALAAGDATFETLEGKQLQGGIDVPTKEEAAYFGSLVLSAISQYTNAPVFVTTRGVRHGVIRSLLA